MIYAYKKIHPNIATSVFVAPNAVIIGDVEIGEDSSVWFDVVIRGDVNSIRIGSRTNIQDGAILHVTYKKADLKIGHHVTSGHGTIVHGCEIEDFCLIGMGACILDGARIGKNSLVAAGSLVLENDRIAERSLVAGVPAIVKRSLTPAEIEEIERSAERYVVYKKHYLGGEFGAI